MKSQELSSEMKLQERDCGIERYIKGINEVVRGTGRYLYRFPRNLERAGRGNANEIRKLWRGGGLDNTIPIIILSVAQPFVYLIGGVLISIGYSILGRDFCSESKRRHS